ncbi:Bccip-like protein [Thalictrum thalictroides]|uniref:Protein BCCIP homolog n=1 Tax=Thalictrum thalictroides TaxID=46969 RepID=A0A7J6URY1_THATH|nr:Bccip-like protein [Thalictrum thalictroides]
MTRRPTQRLCGPRTRPFPFSSFGRTTALVASTRRQSSSLKRHRNNILESPGKGYTKKALKDKNIQPESSSEEDDEETIQADFAFFDPRPDDFHGVKILLQSFLDNKQWDLSGFVDLILGQTTVGTVIKIEDAEDDTPFSVVTALNLGRYKKHRCITEIKDFLIKVSQKDVSRDLSMLLEDGAHNVGLLVSQRVVNLPPQLLPPLYDALFNEVSWATEDEPTEELRKSFRFKSYLIATKIYKHKNADQHKKTSKGLSEDPIIYIKPEDEIFQKISSWSFTFKLHTEQVAAQELRNYKLTGLVMAVEADKIPIFRRELHSLIDGP